MIRSDGALEKLCRNKYDLIIELEAQALPWNLRKQTFYACPLKCVRSKPPQKEARLMLRSQAKLGLAHLFSWGHELDGPEDGGGLYGIPLTSDQYVNSRRLSIGHGAIDKVH